MNKKKFVFVSFFVSMTALAITACGDDVTKINEVHKDGMAVLEAGEKLSKQVCDTTNVGEMLFVMDSSEAFICDGKSWQTLKGEKGETGDAGKDGSDGANGTSCTVKSVKNKADLKGLEVTCGKTVVDTIWNGVAGKDGKPGNPGKAGENGTNCTAKSVENDAGLKGFELTCGETVVGTVWSGQKGGDGETGNDGASCSLTDDGKGSVAVSCGDDDPVTIYKAVCGTQPYDPAKSFCLEGELYDLCDGKTYDPKTQYCLKVTRDGTDIYNVEDLLTDSRDKHVYKTVEIGDQVWMAENLNYDPGDVSAMGEYAWSGCYGEGTLTNEEVAANCAKYGRLYTWDVAMDNADCAYGKTCNASLNPEIPVRGVCPEGWHLPSHYEFEELINLIDPSFGYGHDDDANSATAGKYLKSESGWNNDGNGTDSYGFSALPAGYSYGYGGYDAAGGGAYFWSATQDEGNSDYAYYMYLYNGREYAFLTYGYKSYAFSVRCLRN